MKVLVTSRQKNYKDALYVLSCTSKKSFYITTHFQKCVKTSWTWNRNIKIPWVIWLLTLIVLGGGEGLFTPWSQ